MASGTKQKGDKHWRIKRFIIRLLLENPKGLGRYDIKDKVMQEFKKGRTAYCSHLNDLLDWGFIELYNGLYRIPHERTHKKRVKYALELCSALRIDDLKHQQNILNLIPTRNNFETMRLIVDFDKEYQKNKEKSYGGPISSEIEEMESLVSRLSGFDTPYYNGFCFFMDYLEKNKDKHVSDVYPMLLEQQKKCKEEQIKDIVSYNKGLDLVKDLYKSYPIRHHNRHYLIELHRVLKETIEDLNDLVNPKDFTEICEENWGGFIKEKEIRKP